MREYTFDHPLPQASATILRQHKYIPKVTDCRAIANDAGVADLHFAFQQNEIQRVLDRLSHQRGWNAPCPVRVAQKSGNDFEVGFVRIACNSELILLPFHFTFPCCLPPRLRAEVESSPISGAHCFWRVAWNLL